MRATTGLALFVALAVCAVFGPTSVSGQFSPGVAPLAFQAGQQNNYTFATEMGTRLFYVYVPSSYDGTRNVSLVLAMHGLTDHAVNFAVVFTKMAARAEARGFILLYPQGTTGHRGTGWDAGTCCVSRTVDDVGFVRSLISLVRESFLIRPESIHSYGFSNGGFISETLACELGSELRSIASVSGNTILWPGLDVGLKECDTAYAAAGGGVSVLHVHGDADPIVFYGGDPTSPNFFPAIPVEMAAWASRNGCSGHTSQTLNVTTFTNQVWSDCDGDDLLTVELVVNHGGGHLYPMDPTQGFVASDYICDFMDRATPGGL